MLSEIGRLSVILVKIDAHPAYLLFYFFHIYQFFFIDLSEKLVFFVEFTWF